MQNSPLYCGMLGLAIGDALGVPVEFYSRTALKEKPVHSMRGYGTHLQPPGTWSDDTSMALATADSLRNGYDPEDIMRRFVLWLREGEYTARGRAFDKGGIVTEALERFEAGTPAVECGGKHEQDNGNGSLMRMFPAAVYVHDRMRDKSLDEKLDVIDQTSSLTHGHLRTLIGCEIYSFLVWAILENPSKSAVSQGLQAAKAYYASEAGENDQVVYYERVFRPDFAELPESEIESSGYVVATLEAALWCLLNTDNFKDCALKAVNLGRDTDTVAAVACSLAGILYGAAGIPWKWVKELGNWELLDRICNSEEE